MTSELSLLARAAGRRLAADNMAEALKDDDRTKIAITIYQIMALYDLSYREVAELHAYMAMGMLDE